MSETYVPHPGDRVRFYSWAAQMDLLGEVLSVAPQARMATVREDNEEGQTFIKSWDVLRPFPRADRLARSLADVAKALQDRTEERDEANTRAASWWEAAKDMTRNYYAATETAQRNHERALKAESRVSDRDISASLLTTALEQERARAEKAEAQLRKSVDQSNTHSGHLNDALRNERSRADRLAEMLDATITERDAMTRRAISAEDRAEELEEDRDEWKYRAETGKHADMLRYFLKDANASTDAAMARAEKAEARLREHAAETWTDHDGTVRPLGGIPRAALARQLYDENERAGREKARADKLAVELDELKAALRTLGGDSK